MCVSVCVSTPRGFSSLHVFHGDPCTSVFALGYVLIYVLRSNFFPRQHGVSQTKRIPFSRNTLRRGSLQPWLGRATITRDPGSENEHASFHAAQSGSRRPRDHKTRPSCRGRPQTDMSPRPLSPCAAREHERCFPSAGAVSHVSRLSRRFFYWSARPQPRAYPVQMQCQGE